MRTGPKGEKRPRDANQLAKLIVDIDAREYRDLSSTSLITCPVGLAYQGFPPPHTGQPPPHTIPVVYLQYDPKSNDSGVDVWDGKLIIINSNFLNNPKLDTILAHELGHALMPKVRARGHWQTPFPDWLNPQWEKSYQAPNHKFRFDFKGNLMLEEFGRGADAVNTVVDEVRLWDFPDRDGFRELTELFNNVGNFLQKL
jgi:hypothetical protein